MLYISLLFKFKKITTTTTKTLPKKLEASYILLYWLFQTFTFDMDLKILIFFSLFFLIIYIISIVNILMMMMME